MKTILLIYLLLFGTYTILFGQSVHPKADTKIKNFNSRFIEWDNDRFEAMYNGKWKPNPDSLKIYGKMQIGDTSRFYYDDFMNIFLDESRRIGIVKFGRNIYQFLSNEKYDFHACSLLYTLFPPYPLAPTGTGFAYTSRTEWISSGQQAFDLRFWKDQFYDNAY